MTTASAYQSRIDQLEAGLEAQKAQLRDLATMGAVITSMHEIDAVLSVIMDMGIRLVDGEVGLMMISEKDRLEMKVSWGVTEKFVKNLKYKNDLDLITYCFENREAVILADLRLKAENGVLLNTIISAPIITKEKCLGVVLVINKTNGGNFTEADKEALEMLLSFVAVAVDNSQLLKAKLRQQKIEQDLAVARQVQETILPQNIHDITGVDIGAVYYPAREVGGDFYDIISIDRNQFIVVLGDVSNKGIPAALVMSAASGIIKSIIEQHPQISVDELAVSLNDLLCRAIIKDREMFVTLFFCKFDLDAKRLTYCNAGHLPGLYWEKASRKIKELPVGGPIVGQFPGIDFKYGERELNSGDRLFLFTDGLTEAEDASGNLFGRERVEQVYVSEIDLSPKDFCLKVKEWVDRFTDGAAEDSQDDFTILQVKVD
ncbi:MAG: SpoIIE family protein phosphatase [candidate division Zixibacteria bacterium]|nr:SpoIIE family protein phosphatase [candidate division Zixibacteria bacterium]